LRRSRAFQSILGLSGRVRSWRRDGTTTGQPASRQGVWSLFLDVAPTGVLTAISTTHGNDKHQTPPPVWTPSSLDPPERPLRRYDSICTDTFVAHHLAALPTQVLAAGAAAACLRSECGIRPAINARALASDPRRVIADPLRCCITHNHACRLIEMGLGAHSTQAHVLTTPHATDCNAILSVLAPR
jgi:hypothetical protein